MVFFFFFDLFADKFTVPSFLEALEDSVPRKSESEGERSQTCPGGDAMDEG